MPTNPEHAAYHECGHAIVCVVLGLPLQDSGIHIDGTGRGITFNFHRKPNDPGGTAKDTIEREHSIMMIKAGYLANLKFFPGAPEYLGDHDREEAVQLLNELHRNDRAAWTATDERLTKQTKALLDEHWEAAKALAEVLLAKPFTPQSPECLEVWGESPDDTEHTEQWIGGGEIADVLKRFGLTPTVRSKSDGTYYAADINFDRKTDG